MVRAGANTLHLLGKSIIDDGGSSRASSNVTSGWFFLRVLAPLEALQVADFADNHGIVFSSNRLIQPGWFKIYLNERQVSYARTKPDLIALLSVKQHISPDFGELHGQASFSVQAVEDWSPEPPIVAKKVGIEQFVVSGGTPEEIWSDPRVASITREQLFGVSSH
jgi:hypothetical protein